ncbi:MAG: DUF5711 family protein [Clostridia bacterium]|nr:DUF5711 family protein [Clostridia bacterium]
MALKKEKRSREKLQRISNEPDEINISDDELEEAATAVNPYYSKVASVYSAVRYLLLAVLVLFIAVSAIRNSDGITYDNLMFLMKDLGSVAEASEGNFGKITYNPDTTLSFSGFRNNLAVVTSSGLKIYKGDGSLIFGGEDKFSRPNIETSDRYLLVYDFGGNSFALYNSFARIHKEKFDYDITGADISNSGMFAVVTRTREYNSAVMLYTKNCKLKNRYLSEDRVIDVAINDAGNRLCILSFDAENASYVTRIKIMKPGENSPVTTLELSDIFPLSCNFTSDGNLTVLCDKALYFYDEDGNLLGSYVFGGELLGAELDKKAAVVISSENSLGASGGIAVLGSEGEVIYKNLIYEKVVSSAYCDGYLFTVSGNVLTRVNVKTEAVMSREISGGGKNMVVYSADDVMICSNSSAEYFDFSDKE